MWPIFGRQKGEGFLFNKNNPLTRQCTAPNP